jgi:hypothetical protein
MKNLVLSALILLSVSAHSQERYIGLTRDSIKSFHAKYFETVSTNDTAIVVKNKRDGTDWRFFNFDKTGKCVLAAKEVPFYNDFTDLEKKLKSKKYKNNGEVEYNFGVSKAKGAMYTNGKETYILMYGAINPNMSATTRGIIYYYRAK